MHHSKPLFLATFYCFVRNSPEIRTKTVRGFFGTLDDHSSNYSQLYSVDCFPGSPTDIRVKNLRYFSYFKQQHSQFLLHETAAQRTHWRIGLPSVLVSLVVSFEKVFQMFLAQKVSEVLGLYIFFHSIAWFSPFRFKFLICKIKPSCCAVSGCWSVEPSG